MRVLLYSIIFILCNSTTYFSQQFQLEWLLVDVGNTLYYLGDIDNDGIGEFYNFGSGSQNFYSGADGSLKYTFWINSGTIDAWYLDDRNVYPGEIDFNNNGVNDVHIQAGDEILFVDPSTGEIIFTYYMNGLGRYRWIGDFDNDGIIEICFTDLDSTLTTGATYVYSTGVSVSSVKNSDMYLPVNFRLYQNYPNPFNPSTKIKYSITSPENVSIKIYDVAGQFVNEIRRNHNQAGEYEILWDGKNNFGENMDKICYECNEIKA